MCVPVSVCVVVCSHFGRKQDLFTPWRIVPKEGSQTQTAVIPLHYFQFVQGSIEDNPVVLQRRSPLRLDRLVNPSSLNQSLSSKC